MAGRIRKDDIESVRERTDLAKIVGQYLSLRKAGHDNLVGLCPFHQEKTPSFSVSPAKQVYHCHGCDASGDVFRFVQHVESLSFPEAIERLARDAGVRLRYEGDSPAERRAAARRQSLHRANDEAAALYNRMLLEGREGQEARDYLSSRGFDEAAIRDFEIGYAPMYPDFLLRRLASKLSTEILIDAGLALRDGSGSVRDRFRGRITFPIRDLTGQAVGFGARLLVDAPGQPKYLNSPETDVYRKSRVLYNLHRAKTAIPKAGFAVVVEGYTDVIALARAGIETAVATCGTALGEEHYQLLARFARRVLLAFDSDEAGARAAERAYQFHERYDVSTAVLVLPAGLDPAEYVRQRGGDAFLEAVEQAVPLVQYMIERTLAGRETSTPEGKASAVRAALPIVAGLSEPVRQEQYAGLLADRVGVNPGAVMRQLNQTGRSSESSGTRRQSESPPAAKRVSREHKVELEMLKVLARDDDAFGAHARELTERHFDKALHRKLFSMLVEANGDITKLVAETEDERLTGPLAALATSELEGDAGPDYARRLMARLEEFRLRREADVIRKQLERLNPLKDEAQYGTLFEQHSRLIGQWRRARDMAGAP